MTEPGVRREFGHVSPSQMKEYLLCPRKWFFTSILGFRGPTSDAAQRGTDAHAEFEKYYETGEIPATEKLAACLAFLPPRDSAVLIEQWLPIKLADGLVTKMRADIIDLRDPSLPAVWDHKTSGTTEYFLNEYQMRNDPQMIAYARAVLELFAPEASQIRLVQNQISWLAIDPPRTVECTVSRDSVMSQWNKLESEVVARMREDATKAPVDVRAEWGACKSYRGCPHIERCQSAMFATLEEEPEMRAKSNFLNTLTEDLPLEVATTKPKTRAEVMTAPRTGAQIETLYVDCIPIEVGVTYLSDLLFEPMAELARQTGVPDWRLHEYGRGKGYVAAALKQLGVQGRLPANLYINTREDVSSVALEVLSPLAAAHVYGTR